MRALQELFAFAGEEGSAPAIGNGSSGGGGSASNSPNGKGQVARQWQICVSMIEIYLDAVHDLLRWVVAEKADSGSAADREWV